jgi:hypothetical protein
MAEGQDCDVLSLFVDDIAEEIEVNPDSEDYGSREWPCMFSFTFTFTLPYS